MEISTERQVTEKPWRCPEGHLLGFVIKQKGIRRLRIVNDGDAIAIITGEAQIVCQQCGGSRVWHAGDEAIRELIIRRARLNEKTARAIARVAESLKAVEVVP